jgi:hypothetical protein
MTSHHGRLYALALALVVFFLAWAAVAAHPWARAAADPRLKVLALREAQLRRESRLVQAVVASRWSAYRARLRVRRTEIAAANARAAAVPAAPAVRAAAAPAVRVITLPPHVITRTS